MKFSRLVLVFIAWFGLHLNASSLTCSDLFQTSSIEAGLSASEMEAKILSLSKMRMELDLASVRGDRSPFYQTVWRDFNRLHREVIGTFSISHEKLNEKIRANILNELKKNMSEKVQREIQQSAIANATIDGSKIIFHRIEPGTFLMGEVGKQVATTIEHPFAIAATPTTQLVWRAVVEAAKLSFPGDFDQLLGNPSHDRGELHPVDYVSVEDVELWLEAANKLISVNDPIINEVFPGIKKDEVLRLPTDAEWEFVVRARGAAQDHYYFGASEAALGDYSWHYKNSGITSHPVAEKMPLEFADMSFYDLHGNVAEWTVARNQAGEQVFFKRGGGRDNAFEAHRSGYRGVWGGVGRSGGVGFRLAVTIQ